MTTSQSQSPDWWADVQRFYSSHGYIVVCSMGRLELEHIILHCQVPGSDGSRDRRLLQPFAVTGDSSREEFFAQSRFLGWPEPTGIPSGVFFYRASTD